MSTVTLDAMRETLLSLDDVSTVLSATEPLTSEHITSDSKIKFSLTPGWNEEIDDLLDTDVVAAEMTVNGNALALTKSALLTAASNVGLPTAYVRRTPASLIQDHLNYWYSGGMEDKEYNILSVNDSVAAFTKSTLTPYSNISLLEGVVDGILKTYGSDTEILADYKIHNSLAGTDVRLIIPEQQRTISGGGMRDVPSGEADLWSAGVHLSNSLTGKQPTGVEAYLFRWWCTNGATSTLDNVGTWSRRSSGGEGDVYLWAEETVNEILGGMESKFDEVQALTSLDVAGNVADIVSDIFTQYEVPVSQREAITRLLLEAESLTMYTIMNAITLVGNDPTLNPKRADRLMRIGGSIPTATFDTLKARVWSEGHAAEQAARNPYMITPLSV